VLLLDPITLEMIHAMGALFVDDTNLDTWRDGILDPGELWCQTQIDLTQWSCLLNATGGAFKPKKCFWYLHDYTCKDGEWSYAEMAPRELFITNPDGSKCAVTQKEVNASKQNFGNSQLASQRE
jgi:hypothetical protein